MNIRHVISLPDPTASPHAHKLSQHTHLSGWLNTCGSMWAKLGDAAMTSPCRYWWQRRDGYNASRGGRSWQEHAAQGRRML